MITNNRESNTPAERSQNDEGSTPHLTAHRKNSHTLEWAIWGLLAATVVVIAAAFVRERITQARLKKPLDRVGSVPGFALTNQFAQPVALSNLIGNVWVADVIFSRCPISCERMTQRMRALHDEFKGKRGVKFVSLTADPDFDSPEVLRRYAERHKADPARWHFLTGLKRDVYALAIDGLKFVVRDNDQKQIPDDLFLHSTYFVLVDKRGNIRGYFEGVEEEERKQLAIAVKKLLREK